VRSPAPGSDQAVQVTVDVTNIGGREGDEVAQLYFRENVSSVETPGRSLAGFSRIHLQFQETKTVTFSIPQTQLAVWNAEGKWAVEPGQFTIWAGGSSEASLTAQFRLQH
jgi:beta-glucosidase